MHAELLNLWLFALAIAKESVITGILPVLLFEMLHAKLAESKLSQPKWPRPEPEPEPDDDEDEDDYGKAAIGALAA